MPLSGHCFVGSMFTCGHNKKVTCLQQRIQRQLHRGRVAAWVCDQPCRSYLVPVDLGEAIHRLLLQLGCQMFSAIPAKTVGVYDSAISQVLYLYLAFG